MTPVMSHSYIGSEGDGEGVDMNLEHMHEYACASCFTYHSDLRPEDVVDPGLRECVNLNLHKFQSPRSTRNSYIRAYVSRFGGRPELIVAFRGTSNVRTLLINVVPGHARFPTAFPAARVHRGYYSHYAMQRDAVFAVIDAYVKHIGNADPCKVTIVGHSLGGACASICAIDVVTRYPGMDVGCVTFGSPPAGNQDFCKAFNAMILRSQRVVNERDPAPSLDFMFNTHVESAVTLAVDTNDESRYTNPIRQHDILNYIRNIDRARATLRRVRQPPTAQFRVSARPLRRSAPRNMHRTSWSVGMT